MTPDELFSNNPDIEIKRKPKPTRAKNKTPTFAEQRAGGKDPKHTFTLWFDRDKETRKKDSAHEVNYITNKLKTSINFKKHHNRKIASYNYVKFGKETKVCNKCGKLRGITFFDKLKDPKKGANVRRPYCLMCRRRMNKAAYIKRKNNDTK